MPAFPRAGATAYGGVRVPVGPAVFKTVARQPALSWVGSTPIRLCHCFDPCDSGRYTPRLTVALAHYEGFKESRLLAFHPGYGAQVEQAYLSHV